MSDPFQLPGWHFVAGCGSRWEEGTSRWVKKAPYGVWFVLDMVCREHAELQHGVSPSQLPAPYVAQVCVVDVPKIPKARWDAIVRAATGNSARFTDGHIVVPSSGTVACDVSGKCVAEPSFVDFAMQVNVHTYGVGGFTGDAADDVLSRAKAFAAKLMLNQAELQDHIKGMEVDDGRGLMAPSPDSSLSQIPAAMKVMYLGMSRWRPVHSDAGVVWSNGLVTLPLDQAVESQMNVDKYARPRQEGSAVVH